MTLGTHINLHLRTVPSSDPLWTAIDVIKGDPLVTSRAAPTRLHGGGRNISHGGCLGTVIVLFGLALYGRFVLRRLLVSRNYVSVGDQISGCFAVADGETMFVAVQSKKAKGASALFSRVGFGILGCRSCDPVEILFHSHEFERHYRKVGVRFHDFKTSRIQSGTHRKEIYTEEGIFLALQISIDETEVV